MLTNAVSEALSATLVIVSIRVNNILSVDSDLILRQTLKRPQMSYILASKGMSSFSLHFLWWYQLTQLHHVC